MRYWSGGAVCALAVFLLVFFSFSTLSAREGRSAEAAERVLTFEERVSLAYEAGLAKKRNSVIEKSGERAGRVKDIGRRLHDSLGSDVPRREFYAVIDENVEISVFGPMVFVSSGMIDLSRGCDAILALAIGSSMYFAVDTIKREHGLAELLNSPVKLDDLDKTAEMMRVLGQKESDQVGLLLAAKSGYDPDSAMRFFSLMGAKLPQAVPSFAERKVAAEESLAEARSLFRGVGSMRNDMP